jgi:hypothetical protein
LQKVDFVIIVVVAEVVFVGVVTLRLWIGLEVGLGGVGVVGDFLGLEVYGLGYGVSWMGFFVGRVSGLGLGWGFRVGRGFLWACGLGV